MGVNRSHRSENLKIEYYAYLYMKSQLRFYKCTNNDSRTITYASGKNHYFPSGENHYQL